MTSASPRRGARTARRAIATIAGLLVGLTVSASEVGAENDPDPALGSMYSVVDQIGARDLWANGITGDGVTVAVIDTGIAPVDALTGADKVTAMVDLSFESTVPEAVYLDTYGHGTHMAGIIAGRTPGADPAVAADHPEWFLGVAPDAQIVSIKVADGSGAADISQVIAGVDWAIDHADELGIDVINLSYASGSTLGYEVDPLAYAVERAWNAGIVVVVAAGNDGKQERELASPADDPYVISVVAVEAQDVDKFKVPTWSTSGDGTRNPDVAAPGAHIQSLRVPGSRADVEHPEGYVSDELFLGSGSSQAAAVVAGAVALLLDARPDLTPDEVKALLMDDTTLASPAAAKFSGAGVIKLDDLVGRDVPSDAAQSFPASDGSGSLEAARGGRHVAIDGVPVEGEVTAFGDPWAGTSWAGTRWVGTSWAGSSWAGASWAGSSWAGSSWSGATWTGSSWTGTSWAGATWTGATWTGSSWSGSSWAGSSWSGTTWTGSSWSGSSWAGSSWAGSSWPGSSWS